MCTGAKERPRVDENKGDTGLRTREETREELCLHIPPGLRDDQVASAASGSHGRRWSRGEAHSYVCLGKSWPGEGAAV